MLDLLASTRVCHSRARNWISEQPAALVTATEGTGREARAEVAWPELLRGVSLWCKSEPV